MGQGSITIEDVAKASGVSRQTVSRVINHATNVSASAREKVDAAIAELGYVPSLAARRMGGAKSFVLLALVARGSSSPLPLGRMLLAGIEACSRAGYHLMFEQIDASSEVPPARRIAPLVGALEPDGVIVMPPLDDDAALIAALKERGVRVACLGQRSEFGRTVPGLDESAFSERAAKELIDLGHRQIGFVASTRDRARSQRRIEGYRRALTRVGSRVHRHFLAETPADFPSALRLARRWLTPTIRPTAVLTESAEVALAFRQAAEELGIAMPRELSLLSLENSPALAQAVPAISAMHLPYGALFASACERLMSGSGEQPLEEPRFIERASLARAPRVV